MSWRRGFALLASGQAVGRLCAFLTTLVLARALGAEAFGTVALATAVLGYAALIVDFGFDSLGPVEVGRGDAPRAALASTVMAVRLGSAIVAAAALAAFASAAPLPPGARPIVLGFGLSLPVAALDLKWALLGTGRMGAAAAAEVAFQAVQMAVVLAVVRSPADLWIAPVAYVCGQAASVAVTWIAWATKEGAPRPAHVDRTLAAPLVRGAVPLAGSAAVGMILSNFDLVIIGLWLGTAAAGVYGAAYRVVWLPTALVVTYATALRPTIVRAEAAGPEAAALVLARSHRSMAAVGIGGAVAGILLARPALDVLYGPAYAEAVRPFQVLTGALLLMLFSRPYRVLFVAARRPQWDFAILLGSAAVNVAATLALLPRLGMLGGAWATLASEGVFLAASHAAARRLIPGLTLWRHLARPAVCAAGLAAVVVGLAGWPVAARATMGAAAYVALALLLRILDAREVRGLMESGLPTTAP
jgi:O-antigen/teichoic acid export membrane protein